MQLEVSGPVAQGEVVLSQLGLGRVEGHLVACQPALVAQHGGGMDDGTLEIDVAAQVHVVPLVACLQLPALLTEGKVIESVIISNPLILKNKQIQFVY